jgi:hypothetical protein
MAQDRGEPRQRGERVAGAHERAAEQERAERAAADDEQRAGEQRERSQRQRSGQVVRDEEPDRYVRQHARQTEGAGDSAELPVGELGGGAELGQQRRKSADGHRVGGDDQAQQNDQAPCWHAVCRNSRS